ncbi:hypothetical protein BSZ35_07300 [Salinibacter sp. 10B]|nr:hypothetical protein BSZ35_07300 [Salinibacter sp. 10B]
MPLWQVGNEFLEDLLDLDLRIVRTLPTFFFRPGRLTIEYIEGRRRRYIRPLRLYLFSSFLLFTVLAFTNLNGLSFSFGPDAEAVQQDIEAAQHRIDSLRTALIQMQARGAVPADSTGSLAAIEQNVSGIEAALAPSDAALSRSQNLLEMVVPSPRRPPADTQANSASPSAVEAKVLRLLHTPRDFVRDMIDRAPYLMFLLVPTFALLLKALYLGHKRLYLEHLIFALHVHALAFIAFTLSALLGAWNVALSLDWWLATSPFVYLFLALRHVYKQSPLSTLNKMTVLLIAYGIILVGAVVLLVILTVSLM